MIRRLAKPLIAAFFITEGLNALLRLKDRVEEIEPFVEGTVGKVRDIVPEQVPTDATTLATVDAGVKIGAGLALAFNKFPRLAALTLAAGLVPNSLITHAFWENDSVKSALARYQLDQLLRDGALLGALLLVAGEPRKAKND
ncbi:MAG TPA: DoxX family membrane protein [Pseudonocardiaceae bacterium]|jgi:uncharacterized membrane protein YphA (DoxX/SURF4 family)